jgi:catechol 2,3-dioxygenase-like lactoylglutathione lyase family enzyme
MHVSLDHAHIFASDAAATVQFLQSMFNAELVLDKPLAGARVIRLRIGQAFVNVYDQAPRRPRGGAMHHLGIETNDLEGLVDHMRSRGFVFRNSIRREEAFDYVMVAGPDDLLIELFQCHDPKRWQIRHEPATP